MRSTTSIHTINADKGLSTLKRAAYIVLNYINNAFPNVSVDPRIERRRFSPENVEELLSEKYWNSSPSRLLCDLFWAGLKWEDISKRLGGIRLLDIGCGHGRYVEKFERFSGKRIESYHGIDIYEAAEWEGVAEKHTYAFFTKYDGIDISFALNHSPNLLVTQSTLEHHDCDLILFKQLAEYAEKSLFPIMQIHLFPSAVCLKLFLFHGVRQYTPRTISKITRLFDDRSRIVLYSMGGSKCNDLHWKYITRPILVRKNDRRGEKKYRRKLLAAVREDRFGKRPNFYTLVIEQCGPKNH